ncbi:hypothetical protein NLI96_g13150 [Meripilus lineatus]|uniref:Uncharacterized protein n=1 Tax=Meripilus lineatus TaxID=2056292 RepID=A0AAD5UNV9_9APHY|nr:hypothetical protein NLI96_g13150 [Physisporinus lineatus]
MLALFSVFGERRFELERLHQSFRNVLNDKKLANHIRSATKRRDPTIQKLTKTYNTLVAEIETLIRSGGAPRGARAPRPIAREGLFTLDVDNAIWEDDGPDDISTALWHCNEDVRRGIRYLLQQDRCIEEKKQLQKERSAIQHWFVEEWRSTQMALEASRDDPPLQYQLLKYATKLRRLCVHWRDQLTCIPPDRPLGNDWGISEVEYTEEVAAGSTNAFDIPDEVEDDVDEGDGVSEDDEEGAALMEELETHGSIINTDRSPSRRLQTIRITDSTSPSPDLNLSPRKRSRK